MIKIYVLVTNDIIMGSSDGVIDKDDKIAMMFPALLSHKRNPNGQLGFMLYPWVPNELLATAPIILDTKQIIAELQITSAMERFYNQWIMTEMDKINSFREIFEKQIGHIEKKYLLRQDDIKGQQIKSALSSDDSLTQALVELFDDAEDTWGDPTVTH